MIDREDNRIVSVTSNQQSNLKSTMKFLASINKLKNYNHKSKKNKRIWIFTLIQFFCCACLLFGYIYIYSVKFSKNIISEQGLQHNSDTADFVKELQNTEKKNTNWGNVQYISGYFSKAGQLKPWEEVIYRTCKSQASIHRNEIFDSSCSIPLSTPFGCCYCYEREYPSFLLLDDVWRRSAHAAELEHYKESTTASSVFWFCAERRENSLSSNWTHISFPSESKVVPVERSNVAVITASFGFNPSYKNDMDSFCKKALSGGILKEIGKDVFCYSEMPNFILQNDKFSRHMNFLNDTKDNSARLDGYGFYKALLLQYHAHQSKDGDILVWASEGRIDFLRQGTFNAVIETLAKRGDDLLIETMSDAHEHQWTKGDMLGAFNASKSIRQSGQVSGSAIVIRNSPHMRKFIDAFVECSSDWHMISDDPSILPNSPGFYEHRYDQSILSLLIKTFMTRQGMVGPPARTFYEAEKIYTYRLLESSAPYCPFPHHYLRYKSILSKTNVSSSVLQCQQKKESNSPMASGEIYYKSSTRDACNKFDTEDHTVSAFTACMDLLEQIPPDYTANIGGTCETNIIHVYWKGHMPPAARLGILSILYTYRQDQCLKLKVWVADDESEQSARMSLPKHPSLLVTRLNFTDFIDRIVLNHPMLQGILELSLPHLLMLPKEVIDANAFSDVVRVFVLAAYGGVYLDCDMLLLRPLVPLLSRDFYYRWEKIDKCITSIFHLKLGSPNARLLLEVGLRESQHGSNYSQLVHYYHPWSIHKVTPAIETLPSAYFDQLWVLSNGNSASYKRYGLSVWSDFFSKPNNHPCITSDPISNFFGGAFAFHWHNNWHISIVDNSTADLCLKVYERELATSA